MESIAERALKNPNGYALLTTVVIASALTLGAVAAIQLTRNDLRRTADEAANHGALYVAEGGVQHALRRLDQDRATANSDSGYSASGSGVIADGSYTFTIGHDPNFPDSEPERKLVRATGSVSGGSAEILAHAFVQPPADNVCNNLIASNDGAVRLFGVGAAGLALPVPPISGPTRNLFDGDMFTNPDRDVHFTQLVNFAIAAAGTVRAGGDFHSSTLAGLLSVLPAADLLRGGPYLKGLPETELTHAHLPLVPAVQGIHFRQNDAAVGHGVPWTPVRRAFPRPDYETIRRDPRTVVIDRDHVPVGSWDAATGTWVYGGSLILGSFALNPEVIYYVEGNTRIDTLLLAANSNASIVSRGSIAVENIGLLPSGPLCASLERMIGPASAGASICVQVGPNTRQSLHLVAERDLVIGYETVEVATSAAVESDFLDAAATVGVAVGAGLGMNVANAGGRSEIQAWSEKGELWALVSAIHALSETRLNLCSESDATLLFAASVESAAATYQPAFF